MRAPENGGSALRARRADDSPSALAAALSAAGMECTVEVVDGVAIVTVPPEVIDRLAESAFRSTILAAARALGALRVAVALGDT